MARRRTERLVGLQGRYGVGSALWLWQIRPGKYPSQIVEPDGRLIADRTRLGRVASPHPLTVGGRLVSMRYRPTGSFSLQRVATAVAGPTVVLASSLTYPQGIEVRTSAPWKVTSRFRNVKTGCRGAHATGLMQMCAARAAGSLAALSLGLAFSAPAALAAQPGARDSDGLMPKPKPQAAHSPAREGPGPRPAGIGRQGGRNDGERPRGLSSRLPGVRLAWDCTSAFRRGVPGIA